MNKRARMTPSSSSSSSAALVPLQSGPVLLSDLIKYIDAQGLHHYVADGSLGDNDRRAPGGIYLKGTIAYTVMPAIKIHFNFIKHGSRTGSSVALQFTDTRIDPPPGPGKKERDFIEVNMSDIGAELRDARQGMYRIFNTNLYQQRMPEMTWDNQFIVTID